MHYCEKCGSKTIVGERFGKLVVIKPIYNEKKVKRRGALWLCQCDCGNQITAHTGNLMSGNTKSCGCLIHQSRKKEYSKDYHIYIRKKIRKYTEKNNGCWLWKKSKNNDGYGIISYKGTPTLAHRISWLVFKCEISDNLFVLHKCDNPSCVNPDHLWLGTQSDNMKDMHDKQRHVKRTKENWGKPKDE